MGGDGFLMERYFYLEHSPVYQDKYIIRFDYDDNLFPTGTSGSYDVFISRLLNLSYADYLRYARDRLGAQLVGKNSRYITVLFDYDLNSKALVKLLNKRLEYILNERDFPYDYEEEENGEITLIPFDEEDDEDNE